MAKEPPLLPNRVCGPPRILWQADQTTDESYDVLVKIIELKEQEKSLLSVDLAEYEAALSPYKPEILKNLFEREQKLLESNLTELRQSYDCTI